MSYKGPFQECPPLTKQEALTYDHFHHNQNRNADGTCQVWRRNGQTQTWRTRPDDYRVPVKMGLYRYDSITPDYAHMVHPAERCPREGKG